MRPSETAYADYLKARREGPSDRDKRGYGILDYVQFWLSTERRARREKARARVATGSD